MTYAGDISPEETFAKLAADPDAVLVDVRTNPELVHVGFPDLTTIDKQLVVVEWQSAIGAVNPNFVQQLIDQGVPETAPVYFLCRSGARSRSAATAATAGGFSSAYNVADGFEGPVNAHGHRGSSRGWKAAGLPWRQP